MAGLPLAPAEAPLAQPPRVGLLPTLNGGTAVVEDRTVGFTFDPENCGQSGVGSPELCNTDHDKDIPDNAGLVAAEPFYIWAGDKCSAMQLSRDWQGRARRQLAATESYQVARELWRGDESQANGWGNRFLAHEDSDVVTSGATSPTDALARLEYALGANVKGARGMIHATRHAVTFWHQLGLVRREGNLLLTIHDTLVVPDAGYDGSGPNGQAADEDGQWAYATGMVIARLGPERMIPDGPIAQAVNRADNTIEYRAEREAAVTWDGCSHFAAELNLGWAQIGGAGS